MERNFITAPFKTFVLSTFLDIQLLRVYKSAERGLKPQKLILFLDFLKMSVKI